MKYALFCSAAALALASCSQQTTKHDPENNASENAASAQSAAKPELGAWGVEIDNIDPAVDPGDDFYQYAGGKWLDTFEIPEEFSSYGAFTVLVERSEERVRNIIENAAAGNAPKGSIEQKIGDFYASYLDVETINNNGLASIEADLARINAIETHEDAARLFADPGMNISFYTGAFIDVDAKQSDQYAVYFTQSGLGMPNRNYYFDEKFADVRAKYKTFISDILDLAGVEEAETKADAIYELEKRLAEAHWEPAKRRNRDLTYNKMSREELKAFAPGGQWDIYLDANGLGDVETFIIREDDAIQKMAAVFADTPVALWRDYAFYHHIRNNADILPAAFDEASFEFYGKTLRGTPKQRERWKRGVSQINNVLGEAVGKVYVEKHFPPDAKAQMDQLVANLRAALDQRLDTLPWMSEETKIAAHQKLEKFTPKIGYPEKWQDYSDFEVVRGDAYGNQKKANAFYWKDELSKLGGPIDKTEWGMTPQQVNAYYSPTRNEIVFPAAILQAPFFDPNADPAVNYGGIGAVIGHEIGHGFDDQGRKSDGDGMLRDWWTEEDAANFQKLADALGAQYGEYEPVEGFKVNPELTMGENIGDIGGLAMAYHAYKLSLNGEEAPVIDGLTGDQRFFLAWAQVWKRKAREEAIKTQIATDPHSPARYRVNGVVRNMDAWYDAFNVTEEDALYLAPEERVQIW